MRQYKLLYSLKGHLTECQQRLAEIHPNITTLCKRIKLLSTFQSELRTLSVTLILLYTSISLEEGKLNSIPLEKIDLMSHTNCVKGLGK